MNTVMNTGRIYVHKQVLDSDAIGQVRTYSLPISARVIAADFQGDDLVVWYVFDYCTVLSPRHFVVAFTGSGFPAYPSEHLLSGDLRHIATLQRGGLVYHVFEVKQ